MSSIADLLALFIHSSGHEVDSEIPGDWEALETDISHSRLSSTWYHSVDKGFADCLLSVENDGENLLNIVISRPKFNWRVHQLQVKRGRELKRIVVAPPPSQVTFREIYAAVVDGISQTRRSWKTCNYCGGRQPSAYMQERGICMGCAPSVMGIIY